MHLRLVALVIVAGVVGPIPAWACIPDDGKEDAEYVKCLADDLHDLDGRITAVYEALRSGLDERSKGVLRDEQRVWVRDRDRHCKLESTVTGREQWLHAALRHPRNAVCLIRAIDRRIAALDSGMPHRFESADGAFVFHYAYPLELCAHDTDEGCIHYVGKGYEGSNLGDATLRIGLSDEAKSPAACFDLPGDGGKPQRINGILFRTSDENDGAAGTWYSTIHYATFRYGFCYEATLEISGCNVCRQDDRTNYRALFAAFEEVLGSMRFLRR